MQALRHSSPRCVDRDCLTENVSARSQNCLEIYLRRADTRRAARQRARIRASKREIEMSKRPRRLLVNVCAAFALLTTTAYAQEATVQAQFDCTSATKVCFNLMVSTQNFPAEGRDISVTLLGHATGTPANDFVAISGPQTVHLEPNLDNAAIQVCFTGVNTSSFDAFKFDIKAVGTGFTANGQTEVALGPFTNNCPTVPVGLIPGGGPASSDCYVELNVVGIESPGPDVSGGRVVSCTDGDPCDTDGECGNGSCTFSVAVCINQTDPNLSACHPPTRLQK